MYKFIKQYAETIKGVDVYPLISLFIFLIFFIVLLVLVKKMKKERVEALSNLPLETEESVHLKLQQEVSPFITDIKE